ncbi:ThiF family adenylyltransferase [Cryobacterium breve]|uniref:ThiF family adenylyltransferase n=2 Tax=Cryobacterium breve TaxID=1259258 RepID=A0ABY7NGD6_9MICO|nr:ThiF family adenylyltransferase [Cryobacterium breve]
MRSEFVERDGEWIGDITHRGGVTTVRVKLTARFPFRPARVIPVDADSVVWSWHREIDGALCLVADDDHEDLWWTEAPAFLDHVKAWFDGADGGWVTDRPDLDLDRYFASSDRDDRLYVFGDLGPLLGHLVRFDRGTNGTMRLSGLGKRPRRGKVTDKQRFGYVADLGDVTTPPRQWADISALIDPSVEIDRLISDRSVSIVILHYRRGEHDGAVFLEVWPNKANGITARRLIAGADTPEARTARSGPKASALRGRKVAIVGAGAVGSFVVDALVRSGVGQLTIVDGDRIMPGNLVRHLVGPDTIGMYKPTAIKTYIDRRYGAGTVEIEACDSYLLAPTEAIDLLTEHDLVIDATADFAITAMLRSTAEAIGRTVLSVVMQNGGATYRIDVLPSLDGSPALPSSSQAMLEPENLVYESGCGSPISATPPAAVIEAAAAAARHAIGLLLASPLSTVGEVRDLSGQTPPGGIP